MKEDIYLKALVMGFSHEDIERMRNPVVDLTCDFCKRHGYPCPRQIRAKREAAQYEEHKREMAERNNLS
ncbi:hypothetical protein YA0089_13925 [Pseudomonas viridiflava]|uniref:hypothetical protein n=1 Tax=Pseudomonas viridiflava TaxID=33069 RepID=UPI0018E641FF|nr:hypothetical protein [Pseudomonas viridiflava]MBI6724717.1 hypothetical protein [Pseudomonas viridiflava]